MKMKNKRRKIFIKNRKIWLFSYVPVFLLWFFALEQVTPEHLFVVTNPLDRLIPFCEYFIIPYVLWFPYLIGGLVYFFWKEEDSNFFKLALTLIVGLTVCLIVYMVFPNAQNLRLASYPNENVFTGLVQALQKFDTPTNVCPSIHVFSTVAVCIAILHSGRLRKRWWIQPAAVILAVLICLSTVFLKQHSVTDVTCAWVLNGVLYAVFYRQAGEIRCF